MSKKLTSIKYTSRDYQSIKDDLVEYAKRYYPETFKDFNDASFGALMLDTVAYIGDILSFYLDYQANETFIDTAYEFDNVVRLGKLMGYKFRSGYASQGMVDLYVLVPSNTNGTGPDTDYMPVLKKGSEFVASNGSIFTLTKNVDFSLPEHQIVVAKANSETGAPTEFAIKATGQVISGKAYQELITVNDFQKFLRLELSSPHITDVISVYDAEGHAYYEVDYLSQNVLYSPVPNRGTDKSLASAIMKPVFVPRRFVVEHEEGRTFLQFGYGSDSELYSESVADPSKIILQLHGKDYTTDKSFDPANLIATDKFGIAPANTTLTVVYRKNTAADAFAGVGSVTQVVKALFDFEDSLDLDAAKRKAVIGSLDVNNEEQIIGSPPDLSLPELKQRIKDNYASQNRAVTKQDYKSLIYNMPSEFGTIKRCNVMQDHDSFKRNLNIHVVSEDADGNFTKSGEKNGVLKQNLKMWLNRYRMVNDTIDILDAKIVNVGLEFKLLAASAANKFDVLERASFRLRSFYAEKLDIGEPMYVTDAYKVLNATRGVVDALDVRFVNFTGGDYSDVSININRNLSADGTTLQIPEDHILEIKYPQKDIRGAIK